VVTSPAVGVFRPRPGIGGSRVRAGDRLGAVEVLGIPEEVVAAHDGIVGRLLVEAGEGVEYGQALLELRPAPVPGPPTDPVAGGVGGQPEYAAERHTAAATTGERT